MIFKLFTAETFHKSSLTIVWVFTEVSNSFWLKIIFKTGISKFLHSLVGKGPAFAWNSFRNSQGSRIPEGPLLPSDYWRKYQASTVPKGSTIALRFLNDPPRKHHAKGVRYCSGITERAPKDAQCQRGPLLLWDSWSNSQISTVPNGPGTVLLWDTQYERSLVLLWDTWRNFKGRTIPKGPAIAMWFMKELPREHSTKGARYYFWIPEQNPREAQYQSGPLFP